MMQFRSDKLFRGVNINQYLTKLNKDLEEEIKQREWISPDEDKIDQFKNSLLYKYKIGPIKLLDYYPSHPKKIKVNVQNKWNHPIEKELQEIEIQLQYEGDGNLFFCSLSQTVLVYPKFDHVDTINHCIRFKIYLETLDKSEYEKKVNEVKSAFEVNIPNINRDINSFLKNLDSKIDNLIVNQFSYIQKKQSFLKEIGLVKSSTGVEVSPPPIKKKKVPNINLNKSIKKTNVEDVTLSNEIYQDIIFTLENVGKSIEKKPSLYEGKKEEDIRDILLLFLETRYEGTTATGETFNKTGKTDILLRYAKTNENIFVGECKKWSGISDFYKAIDQLLKYLTLRDSKTSLIVFVENKKFSEVYRIIKDEIKNHKYYIELTGEKVNSRISCIFSLPNDEKINIYIEIIVFHFPK